MLALPSICKTLNGILQHIREVHPHFEGRVMCGINGCPSTASTYESLRQHLYKKHAAELKLELLSDHTPQLTIHDADEPPANDEFGTSDNQGELLNDACVYTFIMQLGDYCLCLCLA